MCKVYNSIGSLTTLKLHLHQAEIDDFKSLKEIIDFQYNYSSNLEQLISNHKILIQQERDTLYDDLLKLDAHISDEKIYSENKLNSEIDKIKEQLFSLQVKSQTNFIQKFLNFIKEFRLKKKLKHNQLNFDLIISNSIEKLTILKEEKKERYQFIVSNFDRAIDISCAKKLSEFERKKNVLDKLKPFIYGALGEQKVVKEVEALSDDFFLINDFCISLTKPIYNKHEKDYIKSIQIDHILISPSGIFIIETKNWSENSLLNMSLRSPVQQIKRTSFVLFKLLSKGANFYNLNLEKHHWGEKKVPVKNLVVLINEKPNEEFQYVKILKLNELVGYIKYFKPIFSNIEIEKIANFLLYINNQKTITIN